MNRTLMIFRAHPDDAEAGAGGLAASLAAVGWRVVLFVATTGRCGGPADVRAREQERAAGILNAEVVWGKSPDGNVRCDRATIESLEAVLAAFDPRLVLTHWPKDTHQDHRRLSQAVLSAGRRRPNLMFYEGPSSYAFRPSVYHPIDAWYAVKLRALAAHGSQLCRTAIQEFAEATARRRGVESRAGVHAEGYAPFRTALLMGAPDQENS